MFFVSALAETNRVPFDLTEGESELVSGFNSLDSSMYVHCDFKEEFSSNTWEQEAAVPNLQSR